MTSPTKRLLLITLSLAAFMMMNGCATDISSQSYSDEHVGEAARSFRAVVVKVREVRVAPDKLEKNKTGALAGGVGGAMVGSQFGSGAGKGLMTLGGAVAGAVGGAYAEKALKTQKALEITVQLKNGELRTIVQGKDVAFRRGERVLVMIYNKGRSKIVKDDV